MIIVHDEFGQPIWFQASNQVTSYSIPNPLLKLPTEEEVRSEAEDECTYPEGQYRDSGTWRVALKEGGYKYIRILSDCPNVVSQEDWEARVRYRMINLRPQHEVRLRRSACKGETSSGIIQESPEDVQKLVRMETSFFWRLYYLVLGQ